VISYLKINRRKYTKMKLSLLMFCILGHFVIIVDKEKIVAASAIHNKTYNCDFHSNWISNNNVKGDLLFYFFFLFI